MSARNVIVGQRVSEEKVLRAKELRREQTCEERILWNCLRRNQLGGFHFRRQQVIDGFIADFYCHAAGLVVEVDGPVHDDQVESDRERDAILAARTLVVLRVTNEEVRDRLSEVLDRILARCDVGARNSPNPPAPFPKREGGEKQLCVSDGPLLENCSPPRFGEGPGEGL